MKFLSLCTILLSTLTAALAAPAGDLAVRGPNPKELKGYDVGYYPDTDWKAVARNGSQFAYILATDSIANIAQAFQANWKGARNAGLITGAFHIGSPYSSTGAAQAHYFLDNSSKWRRDGKTLPGALAMRFAASRASCYDFTPEQLKAWIWDFSNTYKAATGRRPVIQTNTNFWTTCMGSTTDFVKDHKLWLVDLDGVAGPLPAGWSQYTFWMYQDLGTTTSGFPIGNLDKFKGNKAALKQFALGY